jgi:hypothetical protein
MYARHGQLIGGGSPLGEAVVLTPSWRQLRHREVGWGGSPRRKLCTDEQESHMRRAIGVSQRRMVKPVITKNGSCVDAAGVEGNWLFLSGDTCSGAAVCGGGHNREVLADWAGVSRGHSTDWRDRPVTGERPEAAGSGRAER